MPGILDWLGMSGSAPAPSNGVLSGVSQDAPDWASRLNILGATMRDMGANLGGHPADANYLAPILKQQQTKALMAALTSQDPATRQQAYSQAIAMGIDPTPFKASQASQALPKLMDFMQPQEGVNVTPKMGAYGQGDSVAARTGAGMYDGMLPGQSLPQALQSVGNPELSSQMAPQIIAEMQKANEPFTLTPGSARFQNGRQVAAVPEKAPAAPEIVRTAQFLFPNDPKAQNDYIQKNSRASTVNINNGNPGNVQSVQPLSDGTLLVVKRDGSTEHVTADGQIVTGARFDPKNHFDVSAAGAAGKAAGAAAEAFPTVKANFGLIMDTLKGFEDPAVKGQAGKSIGIGSYLPTVPGVNTNFRSHLGQLQGQAFLQAFNTLRGGGQITEVEGEKATNAIARLQKSQTPDEFYSALNEAKGVFSRLYESARERASRGAVVPALNTGPASPRPANNDPLGLR